ncbi:MAG TPA: hypothetical protein VFM11_10740 [Burkholderiales bacterium]|nr:hypothetical protein [Burkholderiales bacterium]
MNEQNDREQFDVERVHRLIGELRAWLERGELSAGDKAKLTAEIDALSERLDKAAPGELRSGLRRISELARKTEDWVATSGIIQALEAAIGI